MSFVDHSFSPERCAELYNILLHKAIVNDPTAVVERNLIPRFLEVVPELGEIPNLETSPLYAFFSRLETTPSPYSDSRFVPLTPEMHQPDPPFFYNELFTSEPSAILLFAQNNYDSPMDGGLFLNLQTYRVIWHWSPGRFPASEKWVSLETVLQSQLDKWESGKFYWDTSTRSLATKRWTESDVTDALAAWDHLISTIERKMPEGAREAHSRLEPLSVESMSSFHLGEFARAFLSRAPRPKFRHIAPGISTFSPETFLETYSSEPSDSFRRTFNLAGSDTEEDWSSLLFPAGNTVPRDVSHNSDFDIKSFDEQWGFGKFTVNRHAGLYTDPDSTHSDGVRLLANSGLPTAFQFHDRCPWGPSHAPRLSQVILYWASLVENGTWSVDADGVANDNGWIDSNLLISDSSVSQVHAPEWQFASLTTSAGADKVIAKYVFDSSSGRDPCYATYTDPANAAESPVPDHGFRVQTYDPLFLFYGWPRQNYSPDPVGQNPRPTSVNSTNWKRDVVYQTTVEATARTTPRYAEATQTTEMPGRNASEA